MLSGLYLSTSNPSIDPTRISAQVISGIGFIGAGTILKEKGTVVGLTTASSIWLVACIGIAIGCGFILGAVVATAFVLVTLLLGGYDKKHEIAD